MTDTIVATTGATHDQAHPKRLVVDGVEIHLPPYARLSTDTHPLMGHDLVTIAFECQRGQNQDHTGPGPRDLVNFTTVLLQVLGALDDRLATQRRRNSLEVNPAKQAYTSALLDGMEEAMKAVQALAAEHLLGHMRAEQAAG